MDTPQVLLEHYLKQLRLPTMVREYRNWPSSVPKRQPPSNSFCCDWWNWK
jgi:hypothetical protein